MSLHLPKPNSGNSNVKPLEDGAYVGVVSGVIDLGLQESKRFESNEIQIVPQTLFLFDLPYEDPIEINGEDAPRQVMMFAKTSSHSKSKMRGLVEAMTGHLTDEEAADFFLGDLIGKSCSLNLGTNKNERNVIKSIGPLTKGINPPSFPKRTLMFDFDDYQTLADVERGINELPEFIRNIIKKGRTYRTLADGDKPFGEGFDDLQGESDLPF